MPASICAACTLHRQPLTLPRDDRGGQSGLNHPPDSLHGSYQPPFPGKSHWRPLRTMLRIIPNHCRIGNETGHPLSPPGPVCPPPTTARFTSRRTMFTLFIKSMRCPHRWKRSHPLHRPLVNPPDFSESDDLSDRYRSWNRLTTEQPLPGPPTTRPATPAMPPLVRPPPCTATAGIVARIRRSCRLSTSAHRKTSSENSEAEEVRREHRPQPLRPTVEETASPCTGRNSAPYTPS